MRILAKLVPTILAGILVALMSLAAYVDAPSSPVEAPSTPNPTTTPNLPACVTEDGAGQALCMWHGSTQGNGMGSTVVSGDCAPSYVGEDASKACIALYNAPSSYVGNDFTGADAVGECLMIENAIEDELLNCFNAGM